MTSVATRLLSMIFLFQYDVVVRMKAEVAPELLEREDEWMQVNDNPDGSATIRFDGDNLDWCARLGAQLGQVRQSP